MFVITPGLFSIRSNSSEFGGFPEDWQSANDGGEHLLVHHKVPKVLKEHVNAQTKEYNGSPQGTFWEADKQLHFAPWAGNESQRFPCPSSKINI